MVIQAAPHPEYVAGECTKGFTVSMESACRLPGVLTVDSSSAIERSAPSVGKQRSRSCIVCPEMVSSAQLEAK
jgi:hypothetical protein